MPRTLGASDLIPRKRRKDHPTGGDASEAKLRRERLRIQNERERVKLAQIRGELVPATKIAETERSIGAEVRSQLLRLPDRMAELLVGKDGRAIHAALEEECLRILGVLAGLNAGPTMRRGRGGARRKRA